MKPRKSKVSGLPILAIVRRRLPQDWTERYHTTPVLIETFVETPRYTGAVYKASGWTHVGTTQGRGRYDRQKQYDKPKKDVWLRPLRKRLETNSQSLKSTRPCGTIHARPRLERTLTREPCIANGSAARVIGTRHHSGVACNVQSLDSKCFPIRSSRISRVPGNPILAVLINQLFGVPGGRHSPVSRGIKSPQDVN